MVTKIKDVKGKDRPPGTVHYIRYIGENNVVITLCDEVLGTDEWQDAFNEKVNCPACILATIKREEVIRKPRRKENMSTKFYLALGIITAFAAIYGVTYLFNPF
jgi:hypothetical protein